jgi:hypothetical protein
MNNVMDLSEDQLFFIYEVFSSPIENDEFADISLESTSDSSNVVFLPAIERLH